MKFTPTALALAIAGLSTPAAAKSDSQIWTNGAVNVKLSDKWRLQEEMTGRWSDKKNGLYEVESNTLLGYLGGLHAQSAIFGRRLHRHGAPRTRTGDI